MKIYEIPEIEVINTNIEDVVTVGDGDNNTSWY